MQNILKSFQSNLHKEIPLTNDMGLEITAFKDDELKLSAPLSNNINDKGSVFGGSSSALMIIAAWSLIKLKCLDNQINADIVIHKNSTTWQKSMYKDLVIKARFSQSYDFIDIQNVIKSNKHQRIVCEINLVDSDDNLFSTMAANYVIIPKFTGNDYEKNTA